MYSSSKPKTTQELRPSEAQLRDALKAQMRIMKAETLLMTTISEQETSGEQADSAGKGICCQARQPKIDPRNPKVKGEN